MSLLTYSRALQSLFEEKSVKSTYMSNYQTKVSSAVNQKDQEYNWSHLSILIAEDEETNFVYLETALQRTGIQVLRAKNGKEAVEIAKVNPQLSLILMDIKMPEMNGLEATRSIKSFRKDITIIAQTAFAMEEDQRNCNAVGCDDFLPKPIRYKVLLDTLAKYFNE